MTKQKRKMIIGILLIVSILFVTGVTYALWSMILIQESTNVVNTACFKINFIEENEITLQNTYPISDEESKKLAPYTFRVENICNTNATYQINLEELESDLKKLSKEYIKVSLNNSKGKILDTYETVEKTLNEAENSKKLTTGVLKAHEEKTFELRLWMDEDTPAVSEAMNANFQSKITIIAVQKEGIPEVSIIAQEKLDGITVDISTVENPKNETLTYFYQLNEENEIESENNTHTFTGLSDGKYKARGRAETLDGIILEEKELEVTIAYENVYVSSSGSDDRGVGSLESPYATLQPAYNKVKNGGNILLLSDIRATSTTNMDIENKNVTLRSNESEIYTILKDPSFTAQVLDITNSNTITTTNIIFDGNEVISNGALIESTNSTLNLNSSTTIKNAINQGRGAAGLQLYLTTCNINDSLITNNKSIKELDSTGGIESSNGTLNIYSGDVSYNSTVGHGGGIFLFESILNLYEGNIVYNKTNDWGGGIAVSSNTKDSIFTMFGGTISNNTSLNWAGGLGLYRTSNDQLGQTIFYLKSGNISNNVAKYNSDIAVENGSQFIDQR